LITLVAFYIDVDMKEKTLVILQIQVTGYAKRSGGIAIAAALADGGWGWSRFQQHWLHCSLPQSV
jgi:hypothetical protein